MNKVVLDDERDRKFVYYKDFSGYALDIVTLFGGYLHVIGLVPVVVGSGPFLRKNFF